MNEWITPQLSVRSALHQKQKKKKKIVSHVSHKALQYTRWVRDLRMLSVDTCLSSFEPWQDLSQHRTTLNTLTHEAHAHASSRIRTHDPVVEWQDSTSQSARQQSIVTTTTTWLYSPSWALASCAIRLHKSLSWAFLLHHHISTDYKIRINLENHSLQLTIFLIAKGLRSNLNKIQNKYVHPCSNPISQVQDGLAKQPSRWLPSQLGK